MADRVKEVAQEEVERVKNITQEVVRSGAYLYPFKGVAYYLSHRSLWKPMLNQLAPTVTLGIGITTFMFVFTYLPQAAVLTIFNGPLAIVTTVLLVLSESSTIFNMLSRAFLIEEALVDTFDATLLSRNMTAIVSEGREVKSGSDPMASLGKLVKRPFASFTPQAIVRYLMYLPLNFIPVVGTVMFVVLQGKRFGPSAHTRYFQLKRMSEKQKDDFVKARQAEYTGYGVPAVLLELIPLASIFFAFTNTVGAALWAADLEQHGTTAPGLRDQARKAQ